MSGTATETEGGPETEQHGQPSGRERMLEATIAVAVAGGALDLAVRSFLAGSPGRWAAIATAFTLVPALAATRGVWLQAVSRWGLGLLTAVVLGVALHEAPGPRAAGPLGLPAHRAAAGLVALHLVLLGLALRAPIAAALRHAPRATATALGVPALVALCGALCAACAGPGPDLLGGGPATLPVLLRPGALACLVLLPLAGAGALLRGLVQSIQRRSGGPLVRDAGLAACALGCTAFGLVVGSARGEVSLSGWPRLEAGVEQIERAVGVDAWWTPPVASRPIATDPAGERPVAAAASTARPPAAAPEPAPAEEARTPLASASAPVVTPAAAPSSADTPPEPASIPATPTTPDDLAGFDLAASVCGGWIATPPVVAGTRPNHAAANLLAGPSAGWAARTDDLPQRVVIGLGGDRPARIDRVVLDTYFWLGCDWNFFLPAHRVRELELEAGPGPDGPFTPLGRFSVPEGSRLVTLRFPPVEARALAVRLLSGRGARDVGLGRVHVLEADPASTVLAGKQLDVARYDAGGGVVRFTGQESENAGAWRLVDGTPDGWTSADGALPQEHVVVFAGGAAAAIGALEVLPPRDGRPQDRPREVEVAVSDVGPLDGFRTVASATLAPEGGRLTLDPPVVARYLRLRVRSNHGGTRTRIGELVVLEAACAPDGRRSLLWGRAAGEALAAEEAGPAPAATGASPEEPSPWPTGPDLEEVEDNGGPERANALPLGATIEGRIAPRGEHDWFRLDLPAAAPGESPLVALHLESPPALRSSLTLRDAEGRVVGALDPGRAAAPGATLTRALPAGSYTIDVTEPRSSIVVVYDLSGSMERDVRPLEAALRAFVARVEPSEEVALLSFQSGGARVRCEFTSDRERLARSLDGAFLARGGTPLYDALRRAGELLEGRPGNRAIVVFSDGADSTSRCSYPALWQQLAARRVQTHTVGLGWSLVEVTRPQGCTGKQALRALADATGGRAWHAPAADRLAAIYDEVATELRRTVRYRIRAERVRARGRLALADAGGALRGLAGPPRLEFLLDASGSMADALGGYRREVSRDARGQLVASLTGQGPTRLEVARDAFERLLERLPDEVEVGLRAYGGSARSDCGGTALLHPIGPLDRARLRALVRGLRPRGKTPIAASLAEVPRDFAGDVGGERVVVLISDGRETCGGDPVAEVRRLQAAGFALRVHVVGFDLGADDADSLRALAASSGGRFLNARDGAALEQALVEVVRPSYRLEDGAGQLVLRGELDEADREVPVGTFRLVLETSPPVVLDAVEIRPDETTRVEVGRASGAIAARVVGRQ